MKTKRILTIISFSALIGLYLTITMPKRVIYVSLALFVLFILIHYFTVKRFTRQLLLSIISIVLSVLYLGMYKSILTEKIEKYDNKENTVLFGEVVAFKNYSGSNCFTVKALTMNGEKINNFNVNIYTGYPLKVGENVKLTGKYKSFTHKSNYIYNYSKDVYGYFYADNIKVIHDAGFSLTKLFSDIRTRLINTAKLVYNDDTLPIVLAMGLGSKELIDSDTQSLFNYTGITHALTVSGLHVGFIAVVLNFVLGILPVKKKIKNILLCISIFMFMGIIGFTPSIIRAGVLTICMLIGRNLIVEMDNYTVLAIIILITLAINPYSSANASLLLSYSAYFGVITGLQLAEIKNFGKIKTSLIVTLFAVLFSSPFLSMMDMNATLLSPIFNIILSPFIRCVCCLSFFGTLVCFHPVILNIVKYSVAPINETLIRGIVVFANYAKTYFGFALLNLGNERLRFVIFIFVFAVAISVIQFKSVKLRRIFVAAFTLIGFICYNIVTINTITVKAFDSGSETSFVLTKADNSYLVLAENISKKRLEQIIKYENIENIKQVVYCPEKYEKPLSVFNYTNEVFTINDSGIYDFDAFSIDATIENRNMAYMIEIGKTRIAFNHKRSDLSDNDIEFYFFGSDTPKSVDANNIYYFYPLLKRHAEMAEELNAYQLYDTLTFRVNARTGNYKIIEDVKNFGS